MAMVRYTAQSFLDGFTSMASIFSPAQRPGSEEALFLSETPDETIASVDQAIMADVESFLHEVEPLILKDQIVYRESQILLTKIQKNRSTLSASQSST